MTAIPRSVALLLGAIATAALLAAATAPAAPAAAGYKKANCAKPKGKTKAAKKARKRCRRDNAARKAVFEQLKDSYLSGSIDKDLLCADGRYEFRTGGAGGTGISRGDSWKVVWATVSKQGTVFEAEVKGEGGFLVGIARNGDQWQRAVARGGFLQSHRDVTYSDGSARCAALPASG